MLALVEIFSPVDFLVRGLSSFFRHVIVNTVLLLKVPKIEIGLLNLGLRELGRVRRGEPEPLVEFHTVFCQLLLFDQLAPQVRKNIVIVL